MAHPKVSSRSRSISQGQLGMWLALASMTALFLATIVAFWITRSQQQTLRNATAALPWGLYVNSGLLVGTSLVLQKALSAIRANKVQLLIQRLWLGLLFIIAFLVSQIFNWFDIVRINPTEESRMLALFTFYLLTGVHAIHVVGGLVPLGWVLSRAYAREYSSSRHEGVLFCVQYWHFLGVMWLLLFGAMLLQ